MPRPASSSVLWATTLGQAGGLQRSRRVGPMRASERSVGRKTLMQDELFNWCWHGFAWGPPICQPALCEIIVVCPSPSLLVVLCIGPLLSLGPLLSSLPVKSSAQACLCASPCHPSRSPVKLARFKQSQPAESPALEEKKNKQNLRGAAIPAPAIAFRPSSSALFPHAVRTKPWRSRAPAHEAFESRANSTHGLVTRDYNIPFYRCHSQLTPHGVAQGIKHAQLNRIKKNPPFSDLPSHTFSSLPDIHNMVAPI
ncbi:hypothetical protein COCMIDRAFT_28848 [Bipolaris oryzae ATCC 44560]|uniref:Uncharacterized protein n=1 Tax=Bipolaris oryzae ATCC 44560 TaxID=930090 RepID=W6ZGE4_COCMI|nr:uncharacterized protein COCMIDRAFT_28848 [Bipolaris oryzae ATCC 44560]EUC42566.1 hypothetical protein COCMIDRAFT_28848 [Bipolaris oryzae ATCC 44560]